MNDLYTIGTISKLSNIPTETLRYYDKIGLFCPEHRDETTGYRYYTKDGLTALLIIRRLRNLGFSIEDIRSALEDKTLDHLKALLLKKEKEYDKSIKILQARQYACNVAYEKTVSGENIRKNFDRNARFEETVSLEKIPKRELIFSRKIMKAYKNSDLSLSRWIDIYEKCTENGLEMKGSIIVIYHDDPLDQFLLKDCDLEFAIEINSEDAARLSKDKTRSWGDFTACTSYFLGDYSGIMTRHVQMIRWINANGYEICGPISEEFIISPLDVYNPSDHVTKIIIPVKKNDEK